MFEDIEWMDFNWSEVARTSNDFGVYMLADGSGDVLFIHMGKLRSSLREHFHEGIFPIPDVDKYWSEIVDNTKIAGYRVNALLEEHYREFGKNPPFNKRRTDDGLRML